MEKSPHLKKEHPAHPSMDFFQLRKEGFDAVQQLSGKEWTDFNDHDPGVTILEQLCYALTDLGYRTEFPIESLLYDLNDSPKKKKELENTFIPPKRIFTTNPLTINDYRKFFIDRIPGVQNISVKPIDGAEGIKGLYRIFIQYKDEPIGDTTTNEETLKKQIKQQVWKHYAATRNLCEDVADVEFFKTQKVRISANIDIGSDVLGEEVLGQLLFELQEYLSPTVKHYNQAELEDDHWSLDEIYDGPMMRMGHIKDESLLEHRTKISKHNFIEIMSSVKGVERVRDIKIYIGDTEIAKASETTKLKEDIVLILHTQFDEGGFFDEKISFFKGGIPYEIDTDTAKQIYLGLAIKGYASEIKPDPPYHKPSYRHNDLETYHSIQKLFPNNYGIGEEGLPKNVSPQRQAYAKQLKGYLLFFEQILANYLSQLLNVRELFLVPSKEKEILPNSTLSKTYSTQLPYHPQGRSDFIDSLRELFAPQQIDAKLEDIKEEESRKKIEERNKLTIDSSLLNKLQILSATSESPWKRRNKFLDHLLARFGESFNEDLFLQSLLSRPASTSDENPDDSQLGRDGQLYKELAIAKIAFLQNYAGELLRNHGDDKAPTIEPKALGRSRARGINYQKAKWGNEEVSVLKERICLMANMPESISHKTLMPNRSFTLKEHDLEGEKDKKKSEKKQVDQSTIKKGQIRFPLQKKEEFKEIIREGTKQSRYRIEPHSDGSPSEHEKQCWALSFQKAINDEKFSWEVIGIFDDQLEAEEKKTKLIKLFQKINQHGEGFHLIEHILLRPQAFKKYLFKYEEETSGQSGISLIGCAYEDEENPTYLQDFTKIVEKGKDDLTQRINEKNSKRKERSKVEKTRSKASKHRRSKIIKRKEEELKRRYEALYNTKHPEYHIHQVQKILKQWERAKIKDELYFLLSMLRKTNFSISIEEEENSLKRKASVYLHHKHGVGRIDNKFAKFTTHFDSIKDAIKAIKKLQAISLHDQYISMTSKEHRRPLLEEAGKEDKFDFYSMRMSVLIPDWPGIFQNPSFRSMFLNLVNTNAPAHISIDYFLLSMDKMNKFEKKFSKWLDKKCEVENHRVEDIGAQEREIEENDAVVKTSALDKALFELDQYANELCEVLLEFRHDKKSLIG